jgi:hypothetical protein
MRRVVCAKGKDGKSSFIIDGEPDKIFRNGDYWFAEVWATDGLPPSTSSKDITPGFETFDVNFPSGATRFRVFSVPPTGESGGSSMHATDTIDYLVIMDGEIDLAADDGSEVHLTRGDTAVQLNGVHEWRNRGTEPCTLAVVMVGIQPR